MCAYDNRDYFRREAASGSRSDRRRRRLRKEDVVANYQVGFGNRGPPMREQKKNLIEETPESDLSLSFVRLLISDTPWSI